MVEVLKNPRLSCCVAPLDPRVLALKGRGVVKALKNPGISLKAWDFLGFKAALPLKIRVCPLLRVQVFP